MLYAGMDMHNKFSGYPNIKVGKGKIVFSRKQ